MYIKRIGMDATRQVFCCCFENKDRLRVWSYTRFIAFGGVYGYRYDV